jgi:hypothetical protein
MRADQALPGECCFVHDPDVEIARMWTLSTAHLRERTCNEWLSSSVAYPKSEYGWFVPVPHDDEDDCPNELTEIFRQAREKGVRWIMFDCDGPIYDPLVVFDW